MPTTVAVPREVKPDEYRVGLRPVGVDLLTRDGHRVLVQADAGVGSGYEDEQYTAVGATIVQDPDELWAAADMVVKVKGAPARRNPTYEERPAGLHVLPLRRIQAAHHRLPRVRRLLHRLRNPRTARPYGKPTLPLLTPMSEVAGKMSVQEGAKYLERPQGGRGVLLGGVTGTPPANVTVLGGGVVGICAAKMAAGLGANVTILDVNLERLRYLEDVMPDNVTPLFSDPHAVKEYIEVSHLVIGAVLISGAKAPFLITRADLKDMLPGSVIVDVAIDQGGCVETARPTTHADPIYEIDGVIHYCVANIPGAVPRTSPQALTNATLPWVLRVANQGARAIAEADPGFAMAINLESGNLYNKPVAEAHSLPLTKAPFKLPYNW